MENEEVSIFVYLFEVLKFRVLYSRLVEWAGRGRGVLGRWEACVCRGVREACVGRAWGVRVGNKCWYHSSRFSIRIPW